MRFTKTLFAAVVALLTLAGVGPAMAVDHPHVYLADEKGNSDIKAGYTMYAGFVRCEPGEPFAPHVPMECVFTPFQALYMKLEARATAWVKMFGRKETIAYAQAKAEDIDGFTTTRVRLTGAGQVLFSDERDGIDISRGVSFTKSKKYGMSGINVTVRGTASAEVGVNFNGGPVGTDIALYVTPYGEAGVTASASVGAGCASARIEGSLSAIEIEVPAVLWVDLGNRITVDLDIDRRHRLMNGKIKAKLSYCLGNASKTIVDRDSNWSTSGLLDHQFTF